MQLEAVRARAAAEALRSGVPSRHAVAELGTTQYKVEERFTHALDAIAEGAIPGAITVSAQFGGGKSHLLTYLQALAEGRGFVTSYVVVSPEMPLGNAQSVLKAVAETARAPGRTGKALRTLTHDLNTNSAEFAQLRLWARDAPIDDRFRALLHVYEEFLADEELRTQILGDFEGKPLSKSILRQKLRELGQLAGYDLSGPRNPLLAHDRILLLAAIFRACGCKGWVILIDELERAARFSRKQRLATYTELGWWDAVASEPGVGLLPVVAMTQGFLEESVRGSGGDKAYLASVLSDGSDGLLKRGFDLLESALHLTRPTREQAAAIKYRVKEIYDRAYGTNAPPDMPGRDVHSSIRSEIRRWITQWDLWRYDPSYRGDIQASELPVDTADISDSELPPADGDEDAG